MKRQRFLTVYDYQAGGVWQYVYADTAEQITAKYPALQVVETKTAWLNANPQKLREYDINDAPDSVMANFMKKL